MVIELTQCQAKAVDQAMKRHRLSRDVASIAVKSGVPSAAEILSNAIMNRGRSQSDQTGGRPSHLDKTDGDGKRIKVPQAR